jgi:hypothetical protein
VTSGLGTLGYSSAKRLNCFIIAQASVLNLTGKKTRRPREIDIDTCSRLIHGTNWGTVSTTEHGNP